MLSFAMAINQHVVQCSVKLQQMELPMMLMIAVRLLCVCKHASDGRGLCTAECAHHGGDGCVRGI